MCASLQFFFRLLPFLFSLDLISFHSENDFMTDFYFLVLFFYFLETYSFVVKRNSHNTQIERERVRFIHKWIKLLLFSNVDTEFIEYEFL